MRILEKICNKCNVKKPIGDFNRNIQMKDGYFGACKPCMLVDKKARLAAKQDVLDSGQSKTCTSCKTYKLVTDFNKNKENADGFSSRCKECYSLSYQSNKEYHNARSLLRYYKKRGGIPEHIDEADMKRKIDEGHNGKIYDKTKLTDLGIERFHVKRKVWQAIFDERFNDIMKMLAEYEKCPADGLNIQTRFYQDIRTNWKLKYKNTAKFEEKFLRYIKGDVKNRA
jgi:hypothetical protein